MALRRPPTRIELRPDDIAEYNEVSEWWKFLRLDVLLVYCGAGWCWLRGGAVVLQEGRNKCSTHSIVGIAAS